MIKQLFTFLFVMLAWALLPQAVGAISSNLVISEVQTQSATSTTQEFVELYNSSAAALDVTGWKLEYTTATGGTTSALATLNGLVPAHSFVLLSRSGYLATADYTFSVGLAEAGGHVRLVDANKQVVDLVGWGTAIAPETTVAASPPKGQSLRRETDATNLFKDTDNNLADFVGGSIDPRTGPRELPPEEEEPQPEPEVPPVEEEPEPEPEPTPDPTPQPPSPVPPVEPPVPPQPPSNDPPRPCHRLHKLHRLLRHMVKRYFTDKSGHQLRYVPLQHHKWR